jgi:hypothetical protein
MEAREVIDLETTWKNRLHTSRHFAADSKSPKGAKK